MNEKKKILILNYLFPPLGGGGGVAAYTIAKGFIQAGYDVDYVTTWYPGLKTFEVIDGISVYRVKVFGVKSSFPATIISIILYPIIAFRKSLQLCFQNKYLFIHSHFVLPAGPLGFMLSKLFRIPHIISLHGGDVYDPTQKRSPHQYIILRYVIRFLLNHADVVIAQSSDTQKNCIQYYYPDKEIKIIPLPYDRLLFEKISRKDLGLEEEKRYIIGIGMLVPRKGFDVFLKGIALLDDSFEGIILGDGPEIDHLTLLAHRLGISHRIHFKGWIQGEKKFQYLAQSDVFILPSIHEPFGIVLQEAMHVGLPIVSTNSGGQVDIIKEGRNGFLISPNDERVLADAITRITDSPEISKKIAILNQSDISRFSIKSITKEILATLHISYE